MWEVDYFEGSWQACVNGDWLPNCYGSKEAALEALVDYLVELLD